MKTRRDFVSNSSSASFIVITDTGAAQRLSAAEEQYTLPDPEFGESAFGWQTEKYGDVRSKLNWCAIVLRDKREQEKYDNPDETLRECVEKPWFRFAEMEKMFLKVCSDAGLRVKIRPPSDEYDYDCYIDHQSAVGEAPENARMFKSEKALRDFLFNGGSYIDCSNDNGGRDEDEYDWTTRRYSSQPEDYYKAKPELG
jgi:hypothetical protein